MVMDNKDLDILETFKKGLNRVIGLVQIALILYMSLELIAVNAIHQNHLLA